MPSSDSQVIHWVRKIRTRLNPEWKGEYKPLLVLSVLELLDDQPEHSNRLEYNELLDIFKRLIAERGFDQVHERQFSNPYIRLRSDQEPIQVWLPQSLDDVDIEKINPANSASIRRNVPYIKINDAVWLSFQSQATRDMIREEINERLFPADTQGLLFEQIEPYGNNAPSLEEASSLISLPLQGTSVNTIGADDNLLVSTETDTDISASSTEQAISNQVLYSPVYSLLDCANATYLPESELELWLRVAKYKKQVIFYGPPGTGKTFIAEHLSRHICSGNGFYEILQFHPAYTYEDFIQGIRPISKESETLAYSYQPGRFLVFCERARRCQQPCVLILDEMNRANLSQVFGELMYLLEYREKQVSLASGEVFSIPQNVIILGTMNTADRSIALVDYALRRRFAFIALRPDYDLLKNFHKEIQLDFSLDRLIEILQFVNREIDDPNYEIGVSFFLRDDISKNIEIIWRMEIEPYLEEYFFTQRQRLEQFNWINIKPRLYE